MIDRSTDKQADREKLKVAAGGRHPDIRESHIIRGKYTLTPLPLDTDDAGPRCRTVDLYTVGGKKKRQCRFTPATL